MKLATAMLLVFTSAGCTPIPPFLFAETAAALKARELSITVAGGGGGGRDVHQCCGGADARIRVGVGHGQELGVEGGIDFSHDNYAAGGKLSYKAALHTGVALVLGFGAMYDGHPSLGGDLALVLSSDWLRGPVRVYGGARLSIAGPLRSDPYAEGGLTEGLVLPLGLALFSDRAARLYLEGGFIGLWSRNRIFQEGDGTNRFSFYGGYGALAFSYVFGQHH